MTALAIRPEPGNTRRAALTEARDDIQTALREIADAESLFDPDVQNTALEFALISLDNAKISINAARDAQ